MTPPLKVCVVTGSRAEYGLLQWVMHDLRSDPDVRLQVVVTGTHLERRFGMTVDAIESDGFAVDARVPLGIDGDSEGDVARAMARGIEGVSAALATLRPDIMLVLGDRFEILAAAQAALIHNVPIAHVAGGDVTEGAFDEAIRHSLTKMAHIHFATNAASAARIRQMGEDPDRIHVVGSPGLDHLRRTKLLEVAQLEAALGSPLGERNLLVTFHPVTLEGDRGLGELRELIAALSRLPGEVILWVTRPNADPGNAAINHALDAWAKERANVRLHVSLGQLRYLSLMALVDAVVGNSSSGLYEAPSFGIPTVDVGDRQAARLAAPSVIRVRAQADAIHAAILQAFAVSASGTENPYGDGRSAGRIVDILKSSPRGPALLRKRFHEVPHG